jgi:hypothetical protein
VLRSVAVAILLPLGAVATLAVPAARAAGTFPMYVSTGGQSIVQVSSTGVMSLFATLPAGSNPQGLAFDGSGNLYEADLSTNQISKITPGGAVSVFATLPANSNPQGLAFDGSVPSPCSVATAAGGASHTKPKQHSQEGRDHAIQTILEEI